MSFGFQIDGPDDAPATVLLAHGAGGAMDSPAMTTITHSLAAEFRVARFEFGYMAARREGGRRPPPRAEALTSEYRAAVGRLPFTGSLVIGGKSMGGRVASMIADELRDSGQVAGLLCIGYPFHPPGRPGQLRTRHLETIRTPTLICQGARDPFGAREEVCAYPLSEAVEILWLEDGDHDLKPRRSSGFTRTDHLRTVAAVARDWSIRIGAAQ